ncbi:pentatricopeptide repeat-containing protein At5g11310, mitochondrial [Amaranthus tricolor]|uniref:pentatricopeptide repeat-containing protein At5g11310, mitochondrial n=1 Tax=Amaranthus tricolor TaxID=29722 RepID=UPI00258C4C29|nr:pentatricopeptide repeat-containing protein At5g11310, mitochondrial [Amaranthus tricolor]XP_057521020.1 pentatricopeptide repeat-containing protein At5g11310, mitochondrial [Amaranthus tricolor]XP_057521021.1 pentatricopeptide repeat-containing protein At5g11310, mitochondrial [Amaranthus tricolor]
MSRNAIFLRPKFIRLITTSIPKFPSFIHNLPFKQSITWNKPKIQVPRFQLIHTLSSSSSRNPNPNPNPNFSETNFNTVCTILNNPEPITFQNLDNALHEARIGPIEPLLLAIFKKFDSSPKLVFSLFRWAEKQPGYNPSNSNFNLMIYVLTKSGEFKWALMVLLHEIKTGNGSKLVSTESLGVLIRHYARLGDVLSAIRIFEFGNTLEIDLFELLLNGLCRYGHLMVACECIDKKMDLQPDWVPSINVYNMLLKEWFRVQNLKQVERVWLRMRCEKVIPGIVTFGILVEGYCKAGFVDRALELFGEMRKYGVVPDRMVYGPVVDGLLGAGRLNEALGVLERFLVLEVGPTFSTFNTLIRGFCKAGDLNGGGKILRMMISRGIMPTAMTYNWFFRYYSKHGKVEEGVNLYRKMIQSGYEPDSLTFHLMLKMLCEEERLDLAMQIRNDMRSKAHVLDSDISTMLIDLLCKMHRLEAAVVEFEDLIQRGCVPNYVSYQTLHHQLKKKGLHEMAVKIFDLVSTARSSTTLPKEFGFDTFHERRKCIMQKARAMSNILKTDSHSKELANSRPCKRSNFRKTSKSNKG